MFFLNKKIFTTDSWQVTGMADAPVDAVFKIMVDAHTVYAKPLLDLKRETNKTKPMNHYFEIDPIARAIYIRGDFWYEGVYSATEIGNQTRITYRVNNISAKSGILPAVSKWLVPLWQYKLPVKMKEEFKSYLKAIGIHLKCKTHLDE